MTSPEKDGAQVTRVADFAAFVRPKEGEDPPIIVGGHAVNLWSEYFLARDVKELLGYLPFTSNDLDLVGSLGLLDRLQEIHKGKLSRSEPRSPEHLQPSRGAKPFTRPITAHRSLLPLSTIASNFTR